MLNTKRSIHFILINLTLISFISLFSAASAFGDTTPPTTTATPAGTVFTSTPQNITLTCTDGTGSGCGSIYYTTDGTIPSYPISGTTQTGASPVTVSITSTTAPTTIKFFARDIAGNIEAVKTETYFIDLSSVTAGTVVINSGDPNTTNPLAALALTCTDSVSACTKMKFSNDGYTWSAPVSYTTSTVWTLSPGDGLKTVYAMFSDSTGTWSRPYSDTIAFDTMPPVNGRWHWRNPKPQGNDLFGAAYGSSTYVTVGALGTILTSSDGLTWATGFSGTSYTLSNVAYGNNTFVAVGSGGTILTSATGTIWTSRTAGTTNNLQDVIFSNNTFIAVGGGGTILTSSDGIDWTSRNSGTSNDLNKITYGNSIFVTVGNAGTILTSGDETIWTSRASLIPDNLGGVAFGNGTFVAVALARNTILTSTDGTTWTSGAAGSDLYGVAFGNNTFVTVGYYSGDLLTSTDGSTWTPAGTSFGPLYGVTYINNAFMAVGWAGAIYTSPNGLIPWTAGSGISATTLYGAAFGNNTFVAVGVGAILASGDGGATWTNGNSPAVGNRYQYGVAFGNGTFVSLQTGNTYLTFLTSGDGLNWTSNTTGYYLPWNNWSVTYGNNTFVAVGNNHQIYTSSNGISWSQQTSPISQSFNGVTFGNNMFVTVGLTGTIITSPDGYTWTSRNSGTANNLSAVTYGNNTFVAVGGISNSTILTSPDGITWTPRNSGTGAWLNGVAFGNNMFVAVGEVGTILVSRDGITWTNSGSGTANRLNGVTFGNASFVVVGDNGTILQSDQYLGSALTIAINDNAGATNSTSVTLKLSCVDAGSGCAEMKFSNDNITYLSPVAYTTSIPWILTPGGGAKSVSVMFSDLYSGTWSEPISANIVLDTTAPLTTAATPGGPYNAPQAVALSCNDGAGGGCSQTYYTVDGSDPTTGSTVYAEGSIIINTSTTLKFFSTDVFGNTEAVRTEVYTIDMAAPTTAASPPAGVYTSAQNVTLTANESSTIYYTLDGTTPAYPVSGTTQSAPSPALVHIAANTTLKFFAMDLAGNIETPVKTAAYIIDLSSIIVSQTGVTINNNDLYTTTTNATLALSCADPGFSCLNMRISNDGTNWSTDEPFAASKPWQLFSGDGLKTVSVMFQDHAGYWSRPYSDTITLDTIPPTSAGLVAPELWYLRNPVPQGEYLYSAAYGNGTYVSVGDYGAILTSTTGTAWTSRTSGTNNTLSGITFGNNTFVAVGGSGTILTSPDGTTWTSRKSGTTNYLAAITFSNNTFVAVGDVGTILTSTDGTTWTSRTSGTISYLSGITFGNSTFVAVGDVGTILTSTEGIDWTSHDTGRYNYLYGVTYGNNTFVAVETAGTILTSSNGIDWTSGTAGSPYPLYGATYGNGTFVAVGDGGTIVTSTTGTAWTSGASGIYNTLLGAAYINSTFVVVGNGTILTSSDTAATWTSSTSGPTYDLYAATFGNNTFVSVGTRGTILTSTDGASWTNADLGTTGNYFYGAAYGNNTFVVVGDAGEGGRSIFTSSDGITWSNNTPSGTEWISTLWSVTFGNGTFVAVGSSGAIVTSTDGIDWTSNDFGTYDNLNAVAFGNGVFVAVGSSGTILTSSNGIDWTSRDSGSSNTFYGVTFGNNTFVAVGDAGDGGRSILTSGDGITWTSRISTYSLSTLYGVTFGNGSFVAAGESGTILTSTYGTAWTDISALMTSNTLKGVVFGNNTFMAVGWYGTILQSNPLLTIKNMINGGAEFTNTVSVTLSLSCIDLGSGCTEMQLSNDNSTWNAPEAYASSVPWTLTPGPDGPRTAYVKFKDNVGNWSDAFSSSIILDSAYVSPVLYTLTVNNANFNHGAITSICDGDCQPAIQCGNGYYACSAVFSANSPVTLVEKPNGGILFTGWTGTGISCSSASCMVTLTSDMTVTAGFIPRGDCTNATFSLDPGSATAPFGGGAGSVLVSQLTGSTSSCRWQVASSSPSPSPWLLVTSGMIGGPGSGTVDYTVTPSPDLFGTLSIAGQTFTVTRTGSTGVLDVAFNAPHGFSTYPTGTSPYTTYITAAALQPDDKIVITGWEADLVNYTFTHSFVGRYNPDGSLDSTFGSGGIVTFGSPTFSSAFLSAVAIQPDDKYIVVAGETDDGALISRLTTTGLLDPGFGASGSVTYNSGSYNYDQFSRVAIQTDDGSIVAAGHSSDYVNHTDIALVSRFTATGLADTNFGANGIVSFNTGTNTQDYVKALGIQSDGNIVAAGYSHDTVTDTDTAVVTRFTTTGQMDSGFGSNGIVSYPTPSTASSYNALTLQPDGKILVAGYTSSANALVTRFTPTGLPDVGFGAQGVVSYSDHAISALALQPDGKIVVAGVTFGYANEDLLVLRLNADGTFDPGFGYNGAVFFDNGSNSSDFATAVLVQPDKKIVVAGITSGANFDTSNGLVLRLLGSGLPSVVSTDPVNGATNVSPNATVFAMFNNPMNDATLDTSSFIVTGPSGTIAALVQLPSGTMATFTPSTALASNTTYTATITTAAKDLAGNALAANYTWSFTTMITEHTITASAGPYGTITPSGAILVSDGGSQTFTVAPNAGYSISDVLVDLVLSQGTVTTYTFTNVTADHTISASFADITPPVGTITINEGAAYTNTIGVTLGLSCSDSGSGCSHVEVSNYNDFSTSTVWSIATGTTVSWTLTAGDGPKNVYAKYTDVDGNPALSVVGQITLDITPPATAATPPAGAYSSARTVALSCTDGLGSGCGVIRYTIDNSDPLLSGLTYTAQVLVSGPTTTLKFFAVDLAGNMETVTTAVYTIDTSQPLVTLLTPTTGGLFNTAAVTYSLNKDMAVGQIFFVRTGGTADSSSPHIYTMTDTDLRAGEHTANTGLGNLVDGTVYTITVDVTDSAARNTTASSTGVTFDSTVMVAAITSPVSGGRVNTATVTYTLNENAMAGDIVIDDGVTEPFMYSLTGSQLASGSHTVDTSFTNSLVDGTVYIFSLANVVDLAGIPTTTVTVPNVTFDRMAVVITNTTPLSKSIITTPQAGYTLSEEAVSGTITFTRSGGNPDPASPHLYTITLASDLTPSVTHIVTPSFTLVDGTFYTVSFAATDLAGNSATTVSNALVYFDSKYDPVLQGNVDNTGSSSNLVDNADVLKLEQALRTRPGDRNWNPVCDLDRNNVVNDRDLFILHSHYGQTRL
jgi:uncharacterized delta-60 repeat protein